MYLDLDPKEDQGFQTPETALKKQEPIKMDKYAHLEFNFSMFKQQQQSIERCHLLSSTWKSEELNQLCWRSDYPSHSQLLIN